MRILTVIPARLAATRLPNKPLADIAGAPMIVHVWRRAMAAGLGPVIVAAGDEAIAQAVRAAGGQAVLTDPGLPSGSDRVWAALGQADVRAEFDIILNLQGDLPTIDPALIRAAADPLVDPAVDIGTLVTEITDPAEHHNPNVVKTAVAFAPGARIGRALYFSRAAIPANPAPGIDGPRWHHIGIYAYRRAALERFVSLPPGLLEAREKLEQLRALEAGMRIDAARVDTAPLGVDTPEDLEKARKTIAESQP